MKILLIIIILCFIQAIVVTSYSIEIESEEKQCFIITATSGVSLSGSFEVISADPTPLIVTLLGPGPAFETHYKSKFDGSLEEEDYSEGSFTLEVEKDGDYTLCFQNGELEKGDGVLRIVAFNFRAIGSDQRDYEASSLQTELLALRQGLEFLKDHQSFMNQREDVHKDTLESINTKILCWTVLESVILLSMAIWQIIYIRSFFETKRRL